MDIVKQLRLRPAREMLYIDGCVASGYGPTVEAQDADEIERLRKIEAAAQLACGVLWMIDGRSAKVTKAFYTLRNAIEGPNRDGLKHAIKAAIDAGYEADHPPSADWWAGKKE